MRTPAERSRVLVGVDGSPASLAAAQFGVDTAARRRAPVTVLNAYQLPGGDRPVPPSVAQDCRLGAQDLVNRVLSQVRVPARMQVKAAVLPGPPVEVLLDRSVDAGLVVIGTHHFDLREHGLLPGGVGSTIGRAVCCPLAVTPTAPPNIDITRRPVVVALDGETAAKAVLGFAFEEAADRGARLLVVHAEQDRARRPDREITAVAIEEIIAGWTADHPDVPVDVLVLPGDPEVVLKEASGRAQLLVVGGPRRHLIGGWPRSVARAILNRSQCPFVMVPQSRATKPTRRLPG